MTKLTPIVPPGDASLCEWILSESEVAFDLAWGLRGLLKNSVVLRNGSDATRYNWPFLGQYAFGLLVGRDGAAGVVIESVPAEVGVIVGPRPNASVQVDLLPSGTTTGSTWVETTRKSLSLSPSQVALVVPLRGKFRTWADCHRLLTDDDREFIAWQILCVAIALEELVLPTGARGRNLIWNADEYKDTLEIGDTELGIVWNGKLSSKTGACLRALHTLSFECQKHVAWHPTVAKLVDHLTTPTAPEVQRTSRNRVKDEPDRFENSGENAQYSGARRGHRESYHGLQPETAVDRLSALLRTSFGKSPKGKAWLKSWIHNRDSHVLFGLLANSGERTEDA
ncbi:MAG: hypothetical protein H6807_11275 [Planctomycetes bacterium]|nr:hypothetical protein [Planctomycetota bacterium]